MEKYYDSNSVYIKNGNQENMIYQYIKEHGCITNLEALLKLGVMQCPARIWGLKRKGINIKTRKRTVIDRYQQKKIIVEYYIEKEGEKAI